VTLTFVENERAYSFSSSSLVHYRCKNCKL